MTTRPAQQNGRAQLFDLDAALEAEYGPFRFTFHGTAYELPPVAAWPMKAQRKLATADQEDPEAMFAALAELLGPVMDKLIDAGMSQVGLMKLITQASEAAGIDGGLPNSPQPAPRVSTKT